MDGIMDAVGMIESVIKDCNESVRLLASGEYIMWCGTVAQMVHKLGLLRDGVRKDLESKNRNIEELKRMLMEANPNAQEIPAEEYLKECGVE